MGQQMQDVCVLFTSGDSHTFARAEYLKDRDGFELLLPDGKRTYFPWVHVREITWHEVLD